ncbi:MAG: methyltransferase domain-containing protein [Gemmataceae bacterium]|nr:methyltransferase domain-containing protein [Gemmataceae bacterium]
MASVETEDKECSSWWGVELPCLPTLLNLGCGRRFHPAWLNLDLHPADPLVEAGNVLSGRWPFPDASFDVVYHSHLLEHLPVEAALPFLQECRRVLQPGGVLRVVVPDLEQIAQLYLQAVSDARRGDESGKKRHEWLTLELLDQLTRERPGGRMLRYLKDNGQDNAFAWNRLGADAEPLRQALENGVVRRQTTERQPPTWWQRWKARLFNGWRERLVRWLLGEEYRLLRAARFRRSGELHCWMYDRCSLANLLEAAGFQEVALVSPTESAIPDWEHFHLDALSDGTVAKPDSLYMEAFA